MTGKTKSYSLIWTVLRKWKTRQEHCWVIWAHAMLKEKRGKARATGKWFLQYSLQGLVSLGVYHQFSSFFLFCFLRFFWLVRRISPKRRDCSWFIVHFHSSRILNIDKFDFIFMHSIVAISEKQECQQGVTYEKTFIF